MSDHPLSPQDLEAFIQQAHTRYMVAVILLTGMLAVALGTMAFALNCRKTGFFALGIYGGLMSFLGVGLAYIFGPTVLVSALAGLAREWLVCRGSNS